MSTISITTTVEQDTALDRIIAKENIGRAAKNPPLSLWTTTTFLQRVIRGILDSYVERMKGDTGVVLKERYEAADAGTQAQVKTLLGL